MIEDILSNYIDDGLCLGTSNSTTLRLELPVVEVGVRDSIHVF